MSRTRSRLSRRSKLAAALALILFGATWHPGVRAALSPTWECRRLASDERIWFESGSEARARAVSAALQAAIVRVEARLGRRFEAPPPFYVCSHQESFNRRVGAPPGGRARGAVFLRRVFLSPRAFDDDALPAVLVHELVHLHLQRQVGSIGGIMRAPLWFQEGLAVSISGGEAVDAADEQTARWVILGGRGLSPEAAGVWWSPRGPDGHGLSAGQFYRQSSLFIEYLAATRPAEFGAFLKRIYDRESFATAFEAFGETPAEAWNVFVETLRRDARRAVY